MKGLKKKFKSFKKYTPLHSGTIPGHGERNMLELALNGSKRYWIWMGCLLAVMGVGAVFYADQLINGLMVTGQSRDVSWGFYTAQMTYFVGVARAALVSLPKQRTSGLHPQLTLHML